MIDSKKKKKKDSQHLVPKVYLKHWRIEEGKNFVYGIDFSDKFKRYVQTFGLNDKAFTQRRYYNDNSLKNPYIIEDFLGQDIEPSYEIIMSEVNNEQNLSQSVREKIIQWLYYSKMRSPYIRTNLERATNFIYKTIERLENESLHPEMEKTIEQHSKKLAKQIQLNTFTDEGKFKAILSLYIKTLNAKNWKILKSNPGFPFLTNDNPGFSLNTVERFAIDVPFHYVLEMNSSSIILYPLSPKYCLEITPFETRTPLDICAMTVNIVYEKVSNQTIEFINKGILYTCNKLIISNNKETIEKYIY